MLGVKTGTGDLTEARTGSATAYTTDGTNTWVQTIGANEPNWHMARRVENLLAHSNDLLTSPWASYGSPETSEEIDTTEYPDGFTQSYKLVASGTFQGRRQDGLLDTSKTYTASVWAKGAAGGEKIWFNDGVGSGGTNQTVTTEWKRYSVSWSPADNNFSIGASVAGTVWFAGVQLEDTTARSSTTPSEYCSTQAATGPNLVTNGTFDSDTDWTKGTGWAISGGTASCDGTQTASSSLQQNAVVTTGHVYKVTFTVSNYSAGQLRPILDGNAGGTYRSANGTYSEYITAAGGNGIFYIQGNVNFIGDIDNVEVYDTTTGVRVFASTNGNSVASNVVTEAVGNPLPAREVTNECLYSEDFSNAAWSVNAGATKWAEDYECLSKSRQPRNHIN
jgi:hypothetical protein